MIQQPTHFASVFIGDVVAVRGRLQWNEVHGILEVVDALIIDKSANVNAMSIWMLEVIHIHKHVYYSDQDVENFVNTDPQYRNN